MKYNKQGFTLLELIIVIVIIAVLAAISAPMISGNKTKAMKTEAITALGAIRTAERLFYVERGYYANVARGMWTVAAGDPGITRYINSSDLNGIWYDFNAYGVTAAADNSTFSAWAVATLSTSLRKSEIASFGTSSIDEAGNINW